MRAFSLSAGVSAKKLNAVKEQRPKSNNTSALFHLLFMFAVMLVCSGSFAQVSLSSLNQDGSTSILNGNDVVSTASNAFIQTLDTELAAANLPANTTQSFVNTTRTAFNHDLAVKINELNGDGVLQAKEVTRELDILRSRHLSTFRNGLSALLDGKAPPPVRDAGTWGEHAVKMLAYTFTQRNQLAHWAQLAATIMAGLFTAWLSSKALRALANTFRQRSRSHIAEMTLSMIGPVYLAIITLALQMASQSVWIPGIAASAIDQLVVILLCSAVFWFLWQACANAARGVTWLIEKTYQAEPDEHMVLIVSRLLRFALIALFGLIFVKQVLDSNLTGFIAGLGAVGVALSFILRGDAHFTLAKERDEEENSEREDSRHNFESICEPRESVSG